MDILEIKRGDFFDGLKHYIAQTTSDDSNLGLLLVDISNLTKINHYYGYDHGDTVLSTAGERLLSVSKLPNTVFRIGSHHFAFILPGLTNPGFIALAINKVTTLLTAGVAVGAEQVQLDISVGVAIGRYGELDPMGLLSMAEASLAHIRSGGDHKMHSVGQEQSSSRHTFQLEKRFRDTLYDNDFQLYFQPKIDLRTGTAKHAEALLRWELSNGEFVAPEKIVEVADSVGSAYALTKWVIHTVVRQLQAWSDSIDVSVALNIQASLVSNPDLRALIEDTLAIWSVDRSRITLEISESAIIDDKESGFKNLLQLKNLGTDLSIDDFGTGYSSMAYFKHIPASELKIDKYFVSNMKDDPLDRELVRIMINTAHLFGMRVVAEGVEDRASLELLQEMNCDYVQGYFFAEPMPAKEFEEWIEKWPGL